MALPAEMQMLLERNGFRLEAMYGNYDGSEVSENSPRMITVASACSVQQRRDHARDELAPQRPIVRAVVAELAPRRVVRMLSNAPASSGGRPVSSNPRFPAALVLTLS